MREGQRQHERTVKKRIGAENASCFLFHRRRGKVSENPSFVRGNGEILNGKEAACWSLWEGAEFLVRFVLKRCVRTGLAGLFSKTCCAVRREWQGVGGVHGTERTAGTGHWYRCGGVCACCAGDYFSRYVVCGSTVFFFSVVA